MTKEDVLDALADMLLERLGGQSPPQEPNPQHRYVGIDEAASLLGVGSATIRKWCHKGAPHFRVGGPQSPIRVCIAEIRTWVLQSSCSEK